MAFKDKNIPVRPSYYTNGCNVSDEYVKIRTVDELKRSDLTDERSVLHGVLTKEEIMPNSFFFYNPE
ncbi:hypothetical protein [Alkalibacterium sp. 20]|uniref:hypothetical protein n=1 Tax=Alkalibacterium sp. 20 TaxID=1798803 RepID=UPI000AB07E0F|nr:hypothetical protein [Alkalibacterium sp. 20]